MPSKPRTLNKPETKPKAAAKPAVQMVSTADMEKLKAADAGYQLARTDLVKFLHGRRQAVFALARRFHLDADDLQQESYEVALTSLRDFNPVYVKSDGEEITVQFNTFFGTRLEGKALEMRNRDPEYQARQAHLSDMSESEREEFRKNPPLLVQHLDQETTMQETLRGEVAAARRGSQTNVAMKIVTDSFMEKKLNELIAAERDDKRRAALLHVKVGGVASFEEIAFHFGVTDSRASQILNELMDAFYVQRLLDGDLKSVLYDFRKLKMNDKRALRLLTEALKNSGPTRQGEIAAAFAQDHPELRALVGQTAPVQAESGVETEAQLAVPVSSVAGQTAPRPWVDPFTSEENRKYPARGLEWWNVADLKVPAINFRAAQSGGELPHIAQLMERQPDNWPLVVTTEGLVMDGVRRLNAAKARGKDKVLCLVRNVPQEAEALGLRVAANTRAQNGEKPDKMELYYAIVALADLGLSQQRIADALGTSRPNVIVYSKVKDKATPQLKSLFEDGYIQITNASACVDLAPAAQDALAAFIRKYGAGWGKGPAFNEVYEAALKGKLDALAARQPTSIGTFAAPAAPVAVSQAQPVQVGDAMAYQALKARINTLENALQDAETWNGQREATLTRQTQENLDLRAKIDSLTREIEAGNLMQHADPATLQNYMKEVKTFVVITERLASARYNLDKAGKSLRGQPLNHRQAQELEQLLEGLSATLNSLRVELVTQTRGNTAGGGGRGLANT